MNKVRLITSVINFSISFLCFVSIFFFHKYLIEGKEGTFIIAAFGASSVIAFSSKTSRLPLYKILICSIIAAMIGVFLSHFEFNLALKISLVIGLTISLMNLIKINYPPAGAITLIPLISNTEIQDLGYLYILYPTVTGLIIIYSFSKIKDNILWLVKKQLKS